MQVQIDVALIIALISLISTGASVIVFLFKIRFEVDALKKENAQQFEKLSRIENGVTAMKEVGSMPTKELGHRIDEIDRQIETQSKTITDLLIEVKSMAAIIGMHKEIRKDHNE